jgi:hypothetical protein
LIPVVDMRVRRILWNRDATSWKRLEARPSSNMYNPTTERKPPRVPAVAEWARQA